MSNVFSVSLSGEQLNDPMAMKALECFLSDCQEAQSREVYRIAEELDVSESCAIDIAYLRMRSRWTEELEDELIALHRAGTPPNIFDFGHQCELAK